MSFFFAKEIGGLLDWFSAGLGWFTGPFFRCVWGDLQGLSGGNVCHVGKLDEPTPWSIQVRPLLKELCYAEKMKGTLQLSTPAYSTSKGAIDKQSNIE